MQYDPKDDLYARLGLTDTATNAQIDGARRRLLLRFHPDRPGGSLLLAQRINEAAEVLLDPRMRVAYDVLRRPFVWGTLPIPVIQPARETRPSIDWDAAFRVAARAEDARSGFGFRAGARPGDTMPGFATDAPDHEPDG